MNIIRVLSSAVCFCACGGAVHAATWYVDAANSGRNGLTGESWETAYATIQAAVDAETTKAGDVVEIRPGVYATGDVTDSLGSRNRVLLTKRLTLRSSDGRRDSVVVVGAKTDGADYGCGADSIRCIGIEPAAAGSVIQGFTLRDGSTDTGSDSMKVSGGGAVYLDPAKNDNFQTYLADCTVIGCSATRGGGIRGIISVRCLFENCRAVNNGAACRGTWALNCVFKNNGTSCPVLAYMSGAVNCTFYESNPGSTIVDANTKTMDNSLFVLAADVKVGGANTAFSHCAAATELAGTDNVAFSGDILVGPAVGDLRPLAGSVLVGAGDPQASDTTVASLTAWNGTDFLGHPRRTAGEGGTETVSIGAFESPCVPVAGKMIFAGDEYSGSVCPATVDGGRVPMDDALNYFYPTQWPTQLLVGVEGVPDGAAVLRYDHWLDGVSSMARTPPSLKDDTLWTMPHPSKVKKLQVNIAAVVYVDDDNYGKDGLDGRTAATAYGTIQDAVEASAPAVIRVLPGIYDKGGREGGITTKDGVTLADSVMSNRVFFTGANLRIVSTDGPERTVIAGAPDPDSENGTGPAAVRCVCMPYSCALQGFTLTGSYPRLEPGAGDNPYGVAFLGPTPRSNAFLADSVVSNNHGFVSCYFATAVRSLFTGNVHEYSVIRESIAANCVFRDNVAQRNSHNNTRLYNCTVYETELTDRQMFAASGTYLYNNIYVAENDVNCGTVANMGGCVFQGIAYAGSSEGASKTVDDAGFAWAETDDFRLMPGSPALGYGVTDHADFSTYATGDFFGNPYVFTDGRPAAGAVHVPVPCATRYVDAENGDDGNDGLSAGAPKRTLAAALADASPMDTVKVARGVYDEGAMLHTVPMKGDAAPSHLSRAVLPPHVTVEATGDAVIDGSGEVRCAVMYDGSALRGFTLRNGVAEEDEREVDDGMGGGVLARNSTAVTEDCMITNCSAFRGGGSYRGSFLKCRFVGNGAKTNASSGREGRYFGCLFSGSSGSDELNYPEEINGCTFLSSVRPVRTAAGRIPIVNSLFTVRRSEDMFPASVSLVGCVYPEGVTTVFETAPVDCLSVSAENLRVDAEGRPVIGANAAVDAASGGYYDGDVMGTEDLGGVPRVMNGRMDVGALEADWRPVYAATLGRSSVVGVKDVSPAVVKSGAAVLMPSGELTLAVDLRNGAHGNGRFRFRVEGSGTLTLTSAGGLGPSGTWTAADGAVEYVADLGGSSPWTGTFAYVPGTDDDGGAAFIESVDLARGTSVFIR